MGKPVFRRLLENCTTFRLSADPAVHLREPGPPGGHPGICLQTLLEQLNDLVAPALEVPDERELTTVDEHRVRLAGIVSRPKRFLRESFRRAKVTAQKCCGHAVVKAEPAESRLPELFRETTGAPQLRLASLELSRLRPDLAIQVSRPELERRIACLFCPHDQLLDDRLTKVQGVRCPQYEG